MRKISIDLFADDLLKRWERLAPMSLEELIHQDRGAVVETIRAVHEAFNATGPDPLDRASSAAFIESAIKARFAPETPGYGLSEEATAIVAALPAELAGEVAA